MIVSIVILNWNGEKIMRRYLPSVVEHSDAEGCEVVVADNGSTDASVKMLHDEFPSVRVIQLDQNYGFTGGYNRAIATLSSKYVLLLNSDVEVTRRYLQPLLATISASNDIAAVMPKVLSDRDKTVFEYAGAAGGYLDVLGLPYCRGRVLSKVEKDVGQYDGEAQEVFWATGAAMLVRRELYEELGGLDEEFFAHMEEIDLCWRAKNRGYKVLCNPQSTVYHLGGATLDNGSPFKLFLNFRNSLYMLYKNLYGIEMVSVIFTRMCFDGAVAAGYLLLGKFSFFRSIFKAHIAFYSSLPMLREKKQGLKPTTRAIMNPLLIWVWLKNFFRK